MSNVISLTVGDDGHLFLGNHILVYHYPAGDIDTIPWPMHCEFRGDNQIRQQLASCLFDEWECNDTCADCDRCVVLPDGELFWFDRELDAT